MKQRHQHFSRTLKIQGRQLYCKHKGEYSCTHSRNMVNQSRNKNKLRSRSYSRSRSRSRSVTPRKSPKGEKILEGETVTNQNSLFACMLTIRPDGRSDLLLRTICLPVACYLSFNQLSPRERNQGTTQTPSQRNFLEEEKPKFCNSLLTWNVTLNRRQEEAPSFSRHPHQRFSSLRKPESLT